MSERETTTMGDETETTSPETDDQRLSTADLVREADDVDAEGGEKREPLFPAEEAERFRGRWTDIQSGFVDQPREAVEKADGLVADLMQRLAASFSDERSQLEQQWDSSGDASTEDLRVALQRYRSFFDRLLSA